MKILIRYTHRAILGFAVAGLVTLALLFSGLRLWLLPRIDNFRHSLEARIGNQIGEAVQVEKLSARLYGFHPEIRLQGLNILDAQGRPAVRFGTVRLNIATFRSLRARELRFDRVEIVGPRLSVRRERDGRIRVVGLSAGEGSPGWVLADGRIDLRDAEIVWQDARSGAPPLSLGRVDLHLRNDRNRHRLSAGFALPKALGRSLRLAVDGEGNPLAAGAFEARAYLEGQGIDLGKLAAVLRPEKFGVQGGRADFRVWLDWPGRLQSAVGDLKLAAPVLSHRSGAGIEHRLALKSLATRFVFSPAADGFRLDLNGFRPAVHEPWPDTRLALAVRTGPDGGLASVAAAASRLDLWDLATAAHGLGLAGKDAAEALRSLSPRGTLENARAFFAPDRPAGERLAVCAGFRSVAVTAWKMVPGVAGLGGRACGTDLGGRANLLVRAGTLDLTGIGMRPAVALDVLDAGLSWRQAERSWIIDVPDLAARNPEIAGRFRFRVALPKSGGAPFLDLRARLTDVNVATLGHYAPRVFMPDTADWIDRSLLAGNIPRWDILFRGFADQYPFYGHEGVFQSVIDIDDLTFRYSRDWPLVTKAKVRFEFDGPTATVDADEGLVGTGRILWVHADVEDTYLGTWIRLGGEVRAGVAESMDFLAQSPLKSIPEKVGRLMDVSGDTVIAMNFDIPLADRLGKLQLKGTANLEGAGVRAKGADLALEGLEGPLQFDADSLRAKGVRGSFLGGPVAVGLHQEEDEIRLSLDGRAGVGRLRERFHSDFWRFAEGEAGYRLELGIPESLDARSAPLHLALHSDLSGIALDLPAPLGKPAAAARPLSVETRYQAGETVPVRLAYGPNLDARLRFESSGGGLKLAAGALGLGLPLPPDDRKGGLTLGVRLDHLDAGPWRAWWAGLGGGGGTGPDLREARLQVGNLAWDGRGFGAVDLGLKRDGQRWQGRVDSEKARGEVSLSPEGIRLDLDRITLPDFSVGKLAPAEQEPAQSPAAEADPAAIPPLHVTARRVMWNNADLGPLELATERRPDGMALRQLSIKSRNHELAVHGSWTRSPGGGSATHVEGTFHVGTLGEFLALLGKTGQVRDTATDVSFGLDWPGGPQAFAARSLGGEVRLQFGKGGLLSIEPGLGRVIGMLNLSSLWRRLSLDFSDLFGKGLAYDGIAGTFRIREGQAVTEAFLIDAVSAKILVSGRIGLAARDLDQLVTVIPHTSAALPIAGVIAGGPAVGAAMLVAERLVGDQFDRLTATRYSVRGPWDRPAINRVYRNLPLDVLDQAWSGVKNLSGFGSKKKEERKK